MNIGTKESDARASTARTELSIDSEAASRKDSANSLDNTNAASSESSTSTSQQHHISMWHVLRHRTHFRNVWLGAFASSMGSWMEHVGIAWIINISTQSQAPVYLGYLSVALLAPTMILGLPAGVLADRMNRKTLLLVTQGIMMVLAALLVAVSWFDWASPGALLGIALGMGITMAFNAPAWQVLTPRLVPREELTTAIFLNGLQFNIARILGPALAGLLLAWKDPTILFAVNAASFIFVMIAISSTPDSPAPERMSRTSPWHEIREAYVFTFHNPGPRAIFLATTIFAFLAVPLVRLLPQFISEVYHTRDLSDSAKELAYGSLLAAMGLGAVAGTAGMKLVPRWYPKHHLIPLSILLGGVAIALFAAATSIWLAGIAMAITGVFWMWAFSLAFAALQLLIPDAMRGRVLATLNVATFGAMALGPLLSGLIGTLLADSFARGVSIQIGVGVPGLLAMIAGFVMLTWRTPEIDGIKPGDPSYDRHPGFFRGLFAASHRPRKTLE